MLLPNTGIVASRKCPRHSSWECSDNSYEPATTFLSLSCVRATAFLIGESDSFLGHIKNNGREYVSPFISMLSKPTKAKIKLVNVFALLISELMNVKCLAWCLLQSNDSTNLSYHFLSPHHLFIYFLRTFSSSFQYRMT